MMEQYLQTMAELLAMAPGEPVSQPSVIGSLRPELLQLLPDISARSYASIVECLDANVSVQVGPVLMLIKADAIDNLTHQLGTICQRFPNQVLIELQHDLGDKTAALRCRDVCFAMGFRHALHVVSECSEYQLYEYRLKNYKQAPEWLNSRFWAHPERFNTR